MRRIGIGRGRTAAPLPHHRTVGARLRRFGGWRGGSVLAQAGRRRRRHGPWAGVAVGQADGRPTPRVRRPRRTADFAGTCPPVPGGPPLVSGSWASPRAVGSGFLQPPPARRRPLPCPSPSAPRLPGARTGTSPVLGHAWHTRVN
jgi:hypothetical protein